jgi:hypothetical protein
MTPSIEHGAQLDRAARSSGRMCRLSPDGSGRAVVPTGSVPTAAYEHDKNRRQLRQRGITPNIARQTEHGFGLGRYRRVVERSFA